MDLGLYNYFATSAKPRRNFVVPGSTCHRFRFRLSFIVAFDRMDLFPSSSSSPLAFVFCCVGGDSKSDIFVVDIFSRTRSEILSGFDGFDVVLWICWESRGKRFEYLWEEELKSPIRPILSLNPPQIHSHLQRQRAKYSSLTLVRRTMRVAL